ncbi:Dendrite extension defective protein 1 [Parelaphostrongylus tenuis]|uniref:Dendrite extension defective protein 1 n=1 Tax=Parelaphostrongylus tenuis TaxID=148309 RepID=A0AAD5R441_PARTN|nr:Dendrite extension defective protein 1 [Parelaphostrongylus tenuis]
MQPLEGTSALPEENTNTFQAALFITDNGTYANFIYSNIGWTQGAEVIIARRALPAGFNRGDNSEYYALPTSGTGNIMYLEEYGNTGIPGEWMFELGEQRVVRCKQGIKGDTCDEECAVGEWGADCALCCHCGEGTCHPLSGECPKGCAECWTGGNCQTRYKSITMSLCDRNDNAFSDKERVHEMPT